MRERHLDPPSGYDPFVGRFVTMAVDVVPDWGSNSIGTLLDHIAAIELDWTFADLQGRDEEAFPAGTWDWFSIDIREEDGQLSPVVEPMPRHLDRLEWVRGNLLDTLRNISDADLDSTFNQGDPEQEVGGAWVLHHLMQHEAEHRGQIGEIKAALRA